MISESQLLNLISRSPIGWIRRSGSMGWPKIILVYHGIQPSHSACLEPDLFAGHMNYIKQHFDVKPLDRLLYDDGYDNVKSAIAITFDDAFNNFLEYVLPLLLALDLPATVYAPVNFLGQRNDWDYNNSVDLLPIMTAKDLREISSAGIEIGSHGLTHRRISSLSGKDIKCEVSNSKFMLEDMLGRPVKSFAYPHGGRRDYNKLAVEAIEDAGYETAVTTRFGRCNDFKKRFELRRIIVYPTDTLEVLRSKLFGRYDWFIIKEALAYQWHCLGR